MTRRRTILALLVATTHALPKDAAILAASGDNNSSSSSNDVCPSKDLVACSSSLPSGFCCPATAKCQALAGGTTALCCPAGSSCDRIQPIGCDVRLQDPKDHADAVVLTSVFDVALEPCDNGCCPFGYSCSSSRQCVRDEDQSKKPGADDKSTTTTTTATASSSNTSSAPSATRTTAISSSSSSSTSATASPTSSHGAGAGENGIKANTMSVIGGVAGGALVLFLLVIVAVLYLRRRRRRKRTNDTPSATQQQNEKSTGGGGGNCPPPPPAPSADTPTRGLNISEPIVQQESSYRTDFMLKSPSAQSSISNQPVNSRWSGGRGTRRNLTPSISIQPPYPGQQQQQQQQQQQRRRSIPNPFNSPSPSPWRESVASSFCDAADDQRHPHDGVKTGHVVNGRLAPIRGMRSSKRIVSREASEESIDVFADENAVPQQLQQRGRDVHDDAQNRITTFSDLMQKADLGDVHRGKRYVPGTTPRM